jgi:hypothetical protein
VVSRTARLLRSNSRVPNARSSRPIAWLTAGWDRRRSAAAREKPPRSATRTKHATSRSIGQL